MLRVNLSIELSSDLDEQVAEFDEQVDELDEQVPEEPEEPEKGGTGGKEPELFELSSLLRGRFFLSSDSDKSDPSLLDDSDLSFSFNTCFVISISFFVFSFRLPKLSLTVLLPLSSLKYHGNSSFRSFK